MARPAWIKQADMKRMASIAKEYGVRVEVEIDGKIFRIAPDRLSEDGIDLTPSLRGTTLEEWRQKRPIWAHSSNNTMDRSIDNPKGRGGYPIVDDPKHPVKKWYDKLGFDPRTMDEKDMQRLQEKAEAQWKASIPGTKVGKRERDALEKLAAIGVNVRVPSADIKGCGWETVERLEARGYIGREELLPPERQKQGYSQEEIWLLEAGLTAWQRLEAS